MKLLSLSLIFVFACVSFAQDKAIRIGSKEFTEGFILAEILAQKIEDSGATIVERRFGMGGTGILFQALESNSIDIYAEYTGTIQLAILKEKSPMTYEELQIRLDKMGYVMSPSLGFENNYGLAISNELSKTLNIKNISDLKNHPNLKMAFSYEFMKRTDGYPGLITHYGIQPKKPLRMNHSLLYNAIKDKKIDVIEVYTTDSKIKKYNLVVLKDDLKYFPSYDAVYLASKGALKQYPQIKEAFQNLENSIDSSRMIDLNALAEIDGENFGNIAREFLNKELKQKSNYYLSKNFFQQSQRHLLLVLIPTLIALLIGIPLGVLATRSPWLGHGILVTTGLFQTIPSLALLCFLIPLFGIGLKPALIALCVYGLLPIVRSTYSGLSNIEPGYHEVAHIIGLGTFQKLARMELPMSSSHILSGIKTTAIINVGMATLAAFIGAGGYGASIVTGLALNDNTIILRGALPAAVMALAIHFLFELLDKVFVPKGLRG